MDRLSEPRHEKVSNFVVIAFVSKTFYSAMAIVWTGTLEEKKISLFNLFDVLHFSCPGEACVKVSRFNAVNGSTIVQAFSIRRLVLTFTCVGRRLCISDGFTYLPSQEGSQCIFLFQEQCVLAYARGSVDMLTYRVMGWCLIYCRGQLYSIDTHSVGNCQTRALSHQGTKPGGKMSGLHLVQLLLMLIWITVKVCYTFRPICVGFNIDLIIQ